MSDLTRVELKVGDHVINRNVGTAYAKARGMKALDESTHNPDGSPRREERTSARSGRPAKEKTSVAAAAEEKKRKAASESAESKED